MGRIGLSVGILLLVVLSTRAQQNADDDEASSGSDPTAPCLGATPMNATCCTDTAKGAVMGGIDFVDLASKVQATDAPEFGVASYTASLNGYVFHFKSDANAKAFGEDPWKFAPAWGGFWGWGVAGEAPSSLQPGGTWLPSANVVSPYWVRYGNRTFLNKGKGPMTQLLANLKANIATGDKEWATMFGADSAKWPFNTACCATDTYFRMATCKPATTTN